MDRSSYVFIFDLAFSIHPSTMAFSYEVEHEMKQFRCWAYLTKRLEENKWKVIDKHIHHNYIGAEHILTWKGWGKQIRVTPEHI